MGGWLDIAILMKTKSSAFDFDFDWRLWVCQYGEEQDQSGEKESVDSVGHGNVGESFDPVKDSMGNSGEANDPVSDSMGNAGEAGDPV